MMIAILAAMVGGGVIGWMIARMPHRWDDVKIVSLAIQRDDYKRNCMAWMRSSSSRGRIIMILERQITLATDALCWAKLHIEERNARRSFPEALTTITETLKELEAEA